MVREDHVIAQRIIWNEGLGPMVERSKGMAQVVKDIFMKIMPSICITDV